MKTLLDGKRTSRFFPHAAYTALILLPMKNWLVQRKEFALKGPKQHSPGHRPGLADAVKSARPERAKQNNAILFRPRAGRIP
jgi:hypothetical protein